MKNQAGDIFSESRLYWLEDIEYFYKKTCYIEEKSKKDFSLSIYFSGPNNHLSVYKGTNKFKYLKIEEISKIQDSFEKDKVNLIIKDRLLWLLVKNTDRRGERIHSLENEYKHSIVPVELTNKKFISLLFKEKFSDNLLEILIDGEEIYDFESDLLIGSRLNNTIEFNNIIRTEGVHPIYIKLQPTGCNHTLILRAINSVEFSKKMKFEDFNFILIEISKMVEMMWRE